MRHKWENQLVYNTERLVDEYVWICPKCEARIIGHWSMGPGAVDNARIEEGILENCKEEQIKRIMEA